MQTATQTAPIAPIHFIRRQDQPASPAPQTTRCSSCHLKDLCLPNGLAAEELSRLDGLMFGRRRVRQGQPAYVGGQPFNYLYAVRSGTFKSTLTLLDGREQVTGFQMPGELMGLDGLASGRHAIGAIALEDAEICTIPYAHLAALAAAHPGLQRVLSRLMSSEIVREHGLMALLGSMNAEERVASFLLNISQRMKARGYSPREFHLRMSRAEIGSYLGMKLETVSRTLSAFQQQCLLAVDKKHVRIVDFDGLRRAFESRLQ